MKIVFKHLLMVGIVFLLSACAPDIAQNSYTSYNGTSGSIYTQEGVVQDIQYNVVVNAPDSGVGAVAGAGGGALLGSSLAGSGTAGILGLLGGALIGGVIGNTVEEGMNHSSGTLYIVRLQGANAGEMVSVIEQDPVPFCVGDHVYVIGNYQQAHLKLNDSYYVNNPRTGCFNHG
jgi:outer membrane lipoprotein SlyB